MFSTCKSLKELPEKEIEFELSDYTLLPSAINECSGMLMEDGTLVALNDGGAGPFLYKYELTDTSKLEVLEVKNARNVDWEAIVDHGDEYLVCDFGNNLGNRKDLTIYHVNKTTLTASDSVRFVYPDQLNFDNVTHNFDCEAMVVIDDQYLIFSKNRGNDNTNIYTSPLLSPNFVFVDSIALSGLVTDAFYDVKHDRILLLQYKVGMLGFKNWVSVIEPLSGNKFKVLKSFEIPHPQQFEAITLLEEDTYLVGSEVSFLNNGGKLYQLSIKNL